jgi:hypothetical protein
MNLTSIVQKVFGMNATPSASELEKVVSQAGTEVKKAEAALAKAKQELDSQAFALMANGNEVAVSRLRKAVRLAADELDDRREDMARGERALAAATAREEEAATQARWRQYEQLVRDQRVATSAELDAAVAQLADVLRRMGESSLNIKQASPQMRRDWPASFTQQNLQRQIEQRLFGLTDGVWRSPAAVLETPATARALPTFKTRAQKDSEYLLAARPSAQPDPPKAA